MSDLPRNVCITQASRGWLQESLSDVDSTGEQAAGHGLLYFLGYDSLTN